jgi:2-methylthioadenine synthetase
MPAQSGNSNVLKRMRRNYTREAYIDLIHSIREKIPGITFSTDMICGFCGETDEEFEDTITLMEHIKYEQVAEYALGSNF